MKTYHPDVEKHIHHDERLLTYWSPHLVNSYNYIKFKVHVTCYNEEHHLIRTTRLSFHAIFTFVSFTRQVLNL